MVRKQSTPSICAWRACHSELEREQQHERAGERDLAAARTAQQVVDQQRGTDAGQQRRQQEAEPQRAGHRHGRRQQPEEQRRLVGVQVAADARNQPVAAAQHVLRDQREARLVGAATGRAGRGRRRSAAAANPTRPADVEQRVAGRRAPGPQQPLEHGRAQPPPRRPLRRPRRSGCAARRGGSATSRRTGRRCRPTAGCAGRTWTCRACARGG